MTYIKGEKPVYAKETVEDVLKYKIVAIPERGLSKETCEVFGVRSGLSESDGKTVVAHYFPQKDHSGKVIGFAKRDLTKGKEDKYHFTSVGKTSPRMEMFGQDVAAGIDRKKLTLFITEGQYDAMSIYEAVIKDRVGTQYEGVAPFVVSISHGTANAVENVSSNISFVEQFSEVCLAFDNDRATPEQLKKGVMKGLEAKQAVAASLLPANVTTVEFGMGMKDANDYLRGGFVKELNKLISFDRRKAQLENIVTAASLDDDEWLKPKKKGDLTKVFPRLDEKLNGFRDRELTVLTAPSSVGKSTVSKIIHNCFLEDGQKVGVIALEESVDKTLKTFTAMKLGVIAKRFIENPLGCGFSKGDVLEAKKYYEDDEKLVFVDHFGSLPIDQLLAKVKVLHFTYGCNRILIDHLSMVVSGAVNNDERKDLDFAMTQLAAFCAGHDIHIMVVSHLNRDISEASKPPKGKEDEPFWVNIRKESLRGSAAIEQLSWNIISIEPEILPDKTRGDVRLVLLKNREWDTLGICDTFHLDKVTGKVILTDVPTLGYG